MAVYVIGDLHLSTNQKTNKSMEVFGRRWQGYTEKLEKNWRDVVTPADTVIVPGDISWAMNLDEALSDLQFIESLPGKKLIGKGNHDFWWSTGNKMNRFLADHGISTVQFLYNNAFRVEEHIVCGTRGWFMEEKQQVAVGEVDYDKIINREVIRLKLSLDDAVKLQKEIEADDGLRLPISVFLHFPPVWLDFVCRPFVDVLHEYGDPDCYFGHIHGMYAAPRYREYENIRLTLVSSDCMDFHLHRL